MQEIRISGKMFIALVDRYRLLRDSGLVGSELRGIQISEIPENGTEVQLIFERALYSYHSDIQESLEC